MCVKRLCHITLYYEALDILRLRCARTRSENAITNVSVVRLMRCMCASDQLPVAIVVESSMHSTSRYKYVGRDVAHAICATHQNNTMMEI